MGITFGQIDLTEYQRGDIAWRISAGGTGVLHDLREKADKPVTLHAVVTVAVKPNGASSRALFRMLGTTAALSNGYWRTQATLAHLDMPTRPDSDADVVEVVLTFTSGEVVGAPPVGRPTHTAGWTLPTSPTGHRPTWYART